jgi:hypothetical protein
LICDYLENDGYFVGHFIVPAKYDTKYKEKHRARKYEYYLKRGEPIPLEYMPKEERELLERRKLYDAAVTDGKGGNSFQPRIAMNIGTPGKDSDRTRHQNDKAENDKPKSWKDWFGR